MDNSILSKKTQDKTNSTSAKPSKRTIQNILNYSKTIQVQPTKRSGVLFFMNN